MDLNQPRTRFAPSPTGYLHIGGARTAIYDWLLAHKNGANLYLGSRIRTATVLFPVRWKDIKESLRWLGLEWDEARRLAVNMDLIFSRSGWISITSAPNN